VRSSSRRGRKTLPLLVFGLVVIGGGLAAWWYFRRPPAAPAPAAATAPPHTPPARPTTPSPAASTTRPALAPERPSPATQPQSTTAPATAPATRPSESAHEAPASAPLTTAPRLDDPTAARASDPTRTGLAEIEQARKLYDAGKLIAARHAFNALLGKELNDSQQAEVRSLLTRIADDTIFGRARTPDDPLIEEYTVASGDVLIRIAAPRKVNAEAIMAINGIADATKLRVGQKLKIPKGPFHARIYKSKFRLDVYLGDLYVRSYRVGLGTDNGTPEGTWRVKERLTRPTYYPPASATDKRIIPPGDPANPLGEYWIGLEGISGAAVGQEGYGIHGTIEPESIGRSASLGCVRMHNEDVGFLHKLLTPGESTVVILP